ncbi:hypothetical protein ACLQ26_20020 [Micromonospora sp. DT43]|uniref:hypothetical protein n=1 Tax=Micromonospora sp. DT43 TaxID=3393440 RepID=UPI003CEE4FBE
MPLPARPIVVLAAAGVAGTTGVVAGTAGALQIARANSQRQRQENRLADRNTEHLTEVERLKATTRALGKTQERAIHDVIIRMEEFLIQNGKQVLEGERHVYDGVTDSDTTDTTGMTKLNPQIAAWAAGIVGSAAVGRTTLTVLREGMARFGTASTGRPIRQLHGAARQSALRAAFAGGSIETGGLGEAFGGKIPYVVAAGVAVLTGGAGVKIAGSLAQADAEKDRQATDDAILELDQYDQRSRWVRLRAYELDDILNQLIPPAVDALDLLESEPFDMEVHGPRLQAALILASGVAQIVDAPLIDADGNLDPHTEQIVFKYRNASKENPDA